MASPSQSHHSRPCPLLIALVQLLLFPYHGLGAQMYEQGLQQDLKLEHVFYNHSFRKKTQLRHDDDSNAWITGAMALDPKSATGRHAKRRKDHGFLGIKHNKFTEPDEFINAEVSFGNRRRIGERLPSRKVGADHSDGWVPSIYPNPIQEPGICRILPFLERKNEKYENFSNHLYLCDPDEVITHQNDIARVADKLWNFTFYYEEARIIDEPGNTHCNEEEHTNTRDILKSHPTTSHFDHDLVDLETDSNKALKGNLHMEIGVAIVDKIDIAAVMDQEYRFYYFDDREEMISDAGQFFASYIHSNWWKSNETMTDSAETSCRAVTGVLIFIAVEDRICFISAGNKIANLPWWRLEKVVSGMSSTLREGRYADAIIDAIDEISTLIDSGPPTSTELFIDFFARFGFVLIFASLTLFMAVFGEHRDRHSRYRFAEKQSELDSVEKEKARILQKGYKTTSCPICLEDLKRTEGNIDDYGIPLVGPDDLALKMLRCGHVFCNTCWKSWISADQGDPYKCPVCRQDVSSTCVSAHTPLNDEPVQTYGTTNNVVDENSTQSQSQGEYRLHELIEERRLIGSSASDLNGLLMDL